MWFVHVITHTHTHTAEFFLHVCFVFLWLPPEVGNGVGGADEHYPDDGYDYYANQGISQ